jgi:hypothetical protein
MPPSGLLVALAAAQVAVGVALSPTPLAFWTFQEPTSSPRISQGSLGPLSLLDGNASDPIKTVPGGIFGPSSAYFPGDDGTNNTRRLYASRQSAPGITSAIAGPQATVSLIAWVYRDAADTASSEGMVAGVWDEYLKARQYALFLDLGACSTAPTYNHGLAAHISPVGGPTPGNRFCITRACDPEPLPAAAWHCIANTYNGTHIVAYLNATLHPNGGDNPYALAGGIYSPEAAGAPGAEFGVGANVVNKTAGAPPVTSNQYKGRVGGLAVFASALSQQEVAQVCGWAQGFAQAPPM